MKIILTLSLAFAFLNASAQNKDNKELERIYKEDQSDRMTGSIDWSVVSKRDSIREVRIYELLEAGELNTGRDYHNAAMVFQHGRDTTSSRMAVTMMRKSLEIDPSGNKWLLAAAIDRDLMRRGEPQIYGTQYIKQGHDAPWELYDIDTKVVSDKERIEYGVETLEEQKIKTIKMNQKEVSVFYQESGDFEKVMELCKQEYTIDAEYNTDEIALNSFGYELMAQKKLIEAERIFVLNTELHPGSWNTYDSLGECYVAQGKNKKAIWAYEKSVELNPENAFGISQIEQLKSH